MISIEDRFKNLTKMSASFEQEADRLAKEIMGFEFRLSKIALPFDLALKISERQLIVWDKTKDVLLLVNDDKIAGNLSSASIKIRQKAIELFPEFLQLIEDKYNQYLNKGNTNVTSNNTQKTTHSPAKATLTNNTDREPVDAAIPKPIRASATKTSKRKKIAKRGANRAKENPKADGM
jgi:hypothetical protein